ncbi:UDP-N-acetylmuramate dehydrogenase [Microlunatus panaciterrae]|uniref:UDP-N-acetylenolpyruvoylglucosamine reductase n=1 Tax=Microlunatus panaciterrae TaxID=400768 RepID=A0ABS2RKH7_9ACTN|nr:UDP-N-acetylmuramate dehydrogenase [Microlunatus panaciterrae]MBM7799506.1 UDP-N-acetylmuramate dehydrogenase [Microlunatus panaciterrae]
MVATGMETRQTAERQVRLADYTTLRVGGPAGRFVVADSESDLVGVVRAADEAREPVLVLGGGSNLLVGDEGFDGTVVVVATRGRTVDVSDCSGATVTLAAGEPWDDFVAFAVAQGWRGVEALSGIPGLVGASPIQNVGAYGSEVSHTIASVRTLDRRTGQIATLAAADCRFSYRSSRFKEEPDRFVVLQVTFQLPLGDLSAPIRYPELARALDVAVGDRVPATAVREAVLALRRAKGMVLDDADRDTWSAGSFFTNPVLDEARAELLPAAAPRFPQPDGSVKTSAAWLIEQAGFAKGYGSGQARLSTKHTLALTNRGEATAAELLALAAEIRAGVQDRFGIRLVPEPQLVGCRL